MGKFCPVGAARRIFRGWFVLGLVQFLRGLGAARLTAMVVVTVALVGFFGFLIMRVTTPQLTTLFTDLSYEDSSAIIKDLERQGIPYEMRNDGAILSNVLTAELTTQG